MNAGRSEDLLVGAVALILVPLIALRVLRGLREGRLPLYRTYLARDEEGAKFGALLGLHLLSLLIVAGISADLLLNLGLRDQL